MSNPHPHAALMLQYAQDAAETDKPWERWEYLLSGDTWVGLWNHPRWNFEMKYRRKPKTIKVNGFNVPEPLKEITDGAIVWLAPCHHEEFADRYAYWKDERWKRRALQRGLFHATKEDAAAHAKAMLGIDLQSP